VTVEAFPLENRGSLRLLLEEKRPGDALAGYYALHHPPARTRLWVHRGEDDAVDGFAVRAQTGQDLFRPLITLRVRDQAAAGDLLRAALPADQPALFSVPEHLSLWVLPLLAVETRRVLFIFRLNPARFEPVLNVFVRLSKSPSGMPLYEIHGGDKLLASAGVNWSFPPWAEIFVQTDPSVRERKFGTSVCAALCRHLLNERFTILFAVSEGNLASIGLAQNLGFEDTGDRELFLTGSIPSKPGG
jgi:RimJ/RimL family protein N-acetyltransferase